MGDRDRRPSLDNWLEPPANRWGFCHVREIVPTACIARGGGVAVLTKGEPIDLDSCAVEANGRHYSARQAMDESYTDALIVVHRGRIVVEHYGPEMAPDRTHLLNSVSKSVTSSLTGVLVSEGLLALDDRLTTHVAELVGTSFEGATVQQLLDMRAGIKFSEDYADLDADVRVYEQIAGHRPRTRTDLVESLYDYMPTLARRGEHGGQFLYQSILTDLLGWVVERAAGAPFAELVASRIWSKIGAEHDAEVTVDPGGCALADGGVCATLRDLARFGLAHLANNSVAERHVIAPDWVRECTRRNDELASAFVNDGADGRIRFTMYHNNWWVLDPVGPVFAGLGINGQFLYLDGATETVVVKYSSWPRALDAELGDLHFAMARSFAVAARNVSGSASR
jgi:CubicO group peptidase (beta-lactamase class C family)